MRRFRWWLADVFRGWANAIEPATDLDFTDLVKSALSRDEVMATILEGNALLRSLK
jgi:hypothetical protein